MKDLSFTYMSSPHTYHTCEFDTVMDFMESFENNRLTVTVLNCTDIDATFFESPLNRKHFNSIKELYEHCVNITK